MSKQTMMLALTALFALVAASQASMASASTDTVAFEPAKGDQQTYRIGVRVLSEGKGAYRDWQVAQSLLRYRVSATKPTRELHVTPRFMRVENEDKVVFSSAQPATLADSPLPALMQAGFDVAIDADDAASQVKASNNDAWRAAVDDNRTPLAAIVRQLLIPALAQPIPAHKGAEVEIAGFQGMPTLRLTVTEVDSDTVTATLAQTDERNDPRFTHMRGRLLIDRDSGWIRALTLISDQHSPYGGTQHVAQTLQAVDNPAVGGMGDGLRRLRINTLEAASPGYDLSLPTRADEATEREALDVPQQPLAHAETGFHVDDEDGALVLTIAHRDKENLDLDQMTLTKLTLRDANGEPLDQGFVLDSIGRDYGDQDSSAVRLLPLGWDRADLSDLAEVEATFRYQPVDGPTYVDLPLRDGPTHLDDTPAKAVAEPIDGGWLVTLTGAYTHLYLADNTTAFKGRSAVTSNRRRHGLTPTDRMLVEGVDTHALWIQQITLKGDIDTFALALYDDETPASTHTLTFTPAPQR